jgi:calcineurin-like phosphoesterase
MRTNDDIILITGSLNQNQSFRTVQSILLQSTYMLHTMLIIGKRNVTGGKGFCKKEFFYRSAHRISYITTKQSYTIGLDDKRFLNAEHTKNFWEDPR